MGRYKVCREKRRRGDGEVDVVAYWGPSNTKDCVHGTFAEHLETIFSTRPMKVSALSRGNHTIVRRWPMDVGLDYNCKWKGSRNLQLE